MPPKTRSGARRSGRRVVKKNVALGHAYIKSTFNNTIVSITDQTGAVISWASSGHVGCKAMDHGMKKVDVFVKGPGSGRETAIRSLQAAGLEVSSITDATPQPHNGCRPTKRRKV